MLAALAVPKLPACHVTVPLAEPILVTVTNTYQDAQLQLQEHANRARRDTAMVARGALSMNVFCGNAKKLLESAVDMSISPAAQRPLQAHVHPALISTAQAARAVQVAPV